MWKDYSMAFIKKNRASSLSVVMAVFISGLFLSLLCSLFFNVWTYEIEAVVLEEGDWQGRIEGALEKADLSVIENFANVEKVIIQEELSKGENIVVHIYLEDKRSIYRILPLIAERLGLEDSAISYHELLLEKYMIHDPQDKEPPLLLAFYLVILLMISVSLILIIHNSFAVSMNARIHQFGIFSSIGATPRQIRICLMQEAAVLCSLPLLIGSCVGIVLSYGILQILNLLSEGIIDRHEAVFGYHPLVFIVTMLFSVLTVLVSAWLPARKISRMTPLEAIRNVGELSLKKKVHSQMLSRLFGIEGELAVNALKAQKKALRTSTLSLTLSFLGFTLMLCFFKLAGISTKHTYFERYQDAWDVMVTVKNTDIENVSQNDEIRVLQGVHSSVVYQTATAVCSVAEGDMSIKVQETGGLEALAGEAVTVDNGYYFVQAPIIIMDDESFEEYCRQISIVPRTDGSIVLNRIWDSSNSNFRYKEYIPFLKEESDVICLQNVSRPEEFVEVPVIGFTEEAPVLREEYDNYALVQFVPASLWKQLGNQIGNRQTDTKIRILARDEMTRVELDALEAEILQILSREYVVESENRIQERMENDKILGAYIVIIGAFCVLLAVIGIANVFSYTLGFVRQRKREFVQYMSIGITIEGIRKIFFMEALVIAGRPLLITLPITAISVGFMITASYLNPIEFLMEAPFVPILLFMMAIFGFVGLAYYIGGKRLFTCSLAEVLRDVSIN